jgi:hypothetical protein
MGVGIMSKLDHPTAAASRAVKLIRDRLPNPLSRELAEPLETIERALEQIRDEWISDLKMLKSLREKGRRKPSQASMDRDKRLWEEKQRKSWTRFFEDHPSEGQQGLRTCVRRHEARLKRNAEIEAFLGNYDRRIADQKENC